MYRSVKTCVYSAEKKRRFKGIMYKKWQINQKDCCSYIKEIKGRSIEVYVYKLVLCISILIS